MYGFLNRDALGIYYCAGERRERYQRAFLCYLSYFRRVFRSRDPL